MAGFVYFVPGAQSPQRARDILAEEGAPHAAELGATLHHAQGPGGSGGMLVAATTDELKYVPEGRPSVAIQRWRKHPKHSWWLGFEPARPPGPADLARTRTLAGHFVELGDGRPWLVPVARRWFNEDGAPAWSVALPTTRALDADGNWTEGEVVARHRDLWAHAERVQLALERMSRGEAPGVSYLDECNMAVCALAANYRVSAIECAELGLLTSDCIAGVAHALVDTPGLETLLGKADAPDERHTSPGALD